MPNSFLRIRWSLFLMKIIITLQISCPFLALADSEKSSEFLIPKKVHFVWIGKRIPQQYINNIRSFVVRNPDYEFNLWIDHPMNFLHSEALLDAAKLHLRIRDLNEAATHLPCELRAIFERERHGVYPNFAAASDIVRVQILLEEGGIYFDTDVFMREGDDHRTSELQTGVSTDEASETEERWITLCRDQCLELFKEAFPKFNFRFKFQRITEPPPPIDIARSLRLPVSRLGNIYAPFGFLCNIQTERKSRSNLESILKSWNNNVLAAQPGSFFLIKLQEWMIHQHTENERMGMGHSRSATGKLARWSKSIWIHKRHDPTGASRFDLTIDLTGPGAVRDTVESNAYYYLASLSVDQLDRLITSFPDLLAPDQSSKNRFRSDSWVRSHLFVDSDQLAIRGFRWGLPGFQDQCDHSWFQEKSRVRKSAEWHG